MSTIIDRLASTFSGPEVSSLPLFTIDPILNAGTLILVEPAANWAAGVPADGASVPNIAKSSALALGITGADSLVFNRDPEANNGTNMKLERTTKGGLHGIMSQSSLIAQDKGAALLYPTEVVNYIIAHPTHSYAWRMWVDVTRLFGGASGSYVTTQMSTSSPADGIGPVSYLGISNTLPATGPRGLQQASAQVPVNPGAGMLTDNRRQAATFGRRALSNRTLTAIPSYVFYRLVLEDLTVSGRSVSAFNAADEALRSAAFSSGGRYFGDTYTAPSTLP